MGRAGAIPPVLLMEGWIFLAGMLCALWIMLDD